MNRIAAALAALIISLGIYPVTGVITEVDRVSDTVVFTTTSGHAFAFKGCEDYASNDLVSVVMYDNGTPRVSDDIPIRVRYSGRAEDLPEAFPHRREFERDFMRDFPGETAELYGMKELTKHTLESRSQWDWYLVEVLTGRVIDEEGNGRLDVDPPYNYISYKELGFEPGTRVVTYLVYERVGGVDAIAKRYDYRLGE